MESEKHLAGEENNFVFQTLSNIKQEEPVEYLLCLPPDDSVEIKAEFEETTKASIENPKKSWKCKHCGHVSNRFYNFTKHLSVHQPKIECGKCSKKIGQHAFEKHLKVCGQSGKKFECSKCNKGFNDNRHFKEHLLTHSDPRPFKCDLCPKTYLRKQAIEMHLNAAHLLDYKFKCDICGNRFKTFVVLFGHKARHKKTCACPICNKMFSNVFEVREHQVVHTLEKNVQCKLCDKKFGSQRYMLKHIRRTHGEKIKSKFSPKNFNFNFNFFQRQSQSLHVTSAQKHSKSETY